MVTESKFTPPWHMVPGVEVIALPHTPWWRRFWLGWTAFCRVSAPSFHEAGRNHARKFDTRLLADKLMFNTLARRKRILWNAPYHLQQYLLADVNERVYDHYLEEPK